MLLRIRRPRDARRGAEARVARCVGDRRVGRGERAGVGVDPQVLVGVGDDAQPVDRRVKIDPRRRADDRHGCADRRRAAGQRIDRVQLPAGAEAVEDARAGGAIVEAEQLLVGAQPGDDERRGDRPRRGAVDADQAVAEIEQIERCGLRAVERRRGEQGGGDDRGEAVRHACLQRVRWEIRSGWNNDPLSGVKISRNCGRADNTTLSVG